MKEALVYQKTRLGPLELNNRFVMAAMHTGLESTADGLQRLVEFYKRRAQGGVGLIITGGMLPGGQGPLVTESVRRSHKEIVRAVHDENARICLQLLHRGRLELGSDVAGPSPLRSRIQPIRPRELSDAEIMTIIGHFGALAESAIGVGYDGVEINGAEGFLLSQFLAPRSNVRTDRWGGSFENRSRLSVLVAREIRRRLPDSAAIIFRMSLADLVEDGATGEELTDLAALLRREGVTALHLTVGWNESDVPTSSGRVPRGAFVEMAKRFKEAVALPVIFGSRINTAALAEEIVAGGVCDFVSMARAFLADPEFIIKARGGDANKINTCIACNQTCLDRSFSPTEPSSSMVVSCMVNPWACHETVLPPLKKNGGERSVAVVGSGPAGLAAATVLAQRGFSVSLFESESDIGGQFRFAAKVPGKSEYGETLRFFRDELKRLGVRTFKSMSPQKDDLQRFSHVFLATGTSEGKLSIPGSEGRIFSAREVFSRIQRGQPPFPDGLGQRVAIVGAGPVAYDLAELLGATNPFVPESPEAYFRKWGILPFSNSIPGSIEGGARRPRPSVREIWILRRSPGVMGAGLGRTTGWAQVDELKRMGLNFIGGVVPLSFDAEGLRVLRTGPDGFAGPKKATLPVDTIVSSIGVVPNRALFETLCATGLSCTLLGTAAGGNIRSADEAIRHAVTKALSYDGEAKGETCTDESP